MLLVAVVACLVATLLPATAGARPPQAEPPPTARDRAFDRVERKLARAHTTRVLVRLAAPAGTEGGLSPAQVRGQRAEIKRRGGAVAALLGRNGARGIHRFATIPYVSAELPVRAVQALRGSGDVVSVSADIALEPLVATSGNTIAAPQAWMLGADGTGQTVAVLDTGLARTGPMPGSEYLHEMAARVVHDACSSPGGGCPNGQDIDDTPGVSEMPICNCLFQHGTMVTSVAATMAPGAGLFPIITSISLDGIATALDYLAELEAERPLPDPIASVNISMGLGECTSDWDAVEAAAANLRALGTAVVAGAGNGGSGTFVGAPACLPSVIAVAATGRDNSGVDTDEYASYSDSSPEVDFWAPGGETGGPCDPQSLQFPVPRDPVDPTTCATTGGLFGTAGSAGTSYASPHVAAAYAVVGQVLDAAGVDRADKVDVATQLLTDNGDPYTDPRNDVTRPLLRLGPAVAAALDLEVDGHTPGEGAFRVIAPERLVDSAEGVGTCDDAPCARFTASSSARVQVTGQGSVPPEGIGSVVLAVSAVNPSSGGVVAVGPDGGAASGLVAIDPSGSSSTVVTAPLDEDGGVRLLVDYTDADVRVDVLGWYAKAGGFATLGFHVLAPTSVLDTAAPTGTCDPSPCARLEADTPVTVQVRGEGDVPGDGPRAVAVRVRATAASGAGTVTIARDDATPASLELAVDDGTDDAGVTVLPLAPDGTVTLRASTEVDVALDVTGWFGRLLGDRFHASTPRTAFNPVGPLGTCDPSPCASPTPGNDVRVKVTGIGDVPGEGVSAVVMTVLLLGSEGGDLEVRDGSGATAATVWLPPATGLRSTKVIVVPDEDGYVTLHTEAGSLWPVASVSGWYAPVS
jgi:hypothetical protein